MIKQRGLDFRNALIKEKSEVFNENLDDSKVGINLLIKQTSLESAEAKSENQQADKRDGRSFKSLFNGNQSRSRVSAKQPIQSKSSLKAITVSKTIKGAATYSNKGKKRVAAKITKIETLPVLEEPSQSKRFRQEDTKGKAKDVSEAKLPSPLVVKTGFRWGESDISNTFTFSNAPSKTEVKIISRKKDVQNHLPKDLEMKDAHKTASTSKGTDESHDVLKQIETTSLRPKGYETKTQSSFEGILKGFYKKQSLTPARVRAREKQINLGKETIGYKNYRKLFPKGVEAHGQIEQLPEEDTTQEAQEWMLKRFKESLEKQGRKARKDDSVDIMPQTPRKTEKLSKRQWDDQVRKWRRSLHLYDTITTREEFEKLKASFGRQ
eukprot:augustus_masked-scaffold_1-processed-gene-21.12-mRNA-1 protein AED:1.00 eAED:1.00 QI:0/-1/0/0/-1/1/1/0/379